MKLTISSVGVYNVIPFTFNRADMSARWKKEIVLSFSFRLFQIAYFPFNFLGTPELLLLTCLCQETCSFSAFIY